MVFWLCVTFCVLAALTVLLSLDVGLIHLQERVVDSPDAQGVSTCLPVGEVLRRLIAFYFSNLLLFAWAGLTNRA